MEGDIVDIGRVPTRRYEERQTAIIASAVEILNRKGVRGMTLGEVAARLDLVPTGVIYYFRNKDELASACFLRGLEIFNRFVAEGAAEATTLDKLQRFVAAYVEFQRQASLGEAEPLAVFNDVRALRHAVVNDAYVEMFRQVRGYFAGPETSGLSRLESNARTHLLLSELQWTVTWLPRSEPEDYARAADRLSSMLAHGIAAPGADWPATTIDLSALDAKPAADGSFEQFLRAATQVINEEGYVGASVEKISARLNVTKGAFYHHNQAKDDLVLACFERTFEVMHSAIRAAEQASSSRLQALVSLSAVLVDCQLSGRSPLLRASTVTSMPHAIRPKLLKMSRRVSDRLASLISDGVAEGSLRPVDVNIAAQGVQAMINAAVALRVWAPKMADGDAEDLYVRPFFMGLLSPSRS